MVVAITCRNELRTPEKISGSALGNSTRQSTCEPRMPIPRAASRTAGSTASMPA